MIVRIGKVLRLDINGNIHYININSFSLKEVNNVVNFFQGDKLIIRVQLSDLDQSIKEIISLTDETEKGEQGKKGDTGANGTNGIDGLNGKDAKDGIDGTNGRDGVDGRDGISGSNGENGKDGKDFEITPSLISEIRGKEGEKGKDGTNGTNGIDGTNGRDGSNGVNGLNGSNGVDGDSIVFSGEYSFEDTYNKNETVQYQGAVWIAISDVPEKEPPLNPSLNKDFWELFVARGDAGIQGLSGVNGANGQGVPVGGTTGQHLAKIDGTDYNTQWVTPSGGGGGVDSVTGDGVDNTDPANPVLSFPTPTELGLGNVDNTSDLNKPISTATQTALDLKEDAFSKNTAFNKDFGTTTGTVLEGDTTTITPTQSGDITTNNSKVSFPEAPNDGQEYVRQSLGWSVASGGGGGEPTLRNVTSTDTFATASETINCTSGTFTVNLPTAVGIQGRVFTLVNSGTGKITLDANGTETINGSLTIEIKKNQISRTVQSDGSNWIII